MTPHGSLAPAQDGGHRRDTRNNASQAVFAAYLNTSVSTVQKWERGEKRPHGPSLKLLSVVESKGAAGATIESSAP